MTFKSSLARIVLMSGMGLGLGSASTPLINHYIQGKQVFPLEGMQRDEFVHAQYVSIGLTASGMLLGYRFSNNRRKEQRE